MAYLLDIGVFIQAQNLHYNMEFCPAFWEWLEIANGNHNLFTTDKVYYSLTKNEQDLKDWFFKMKNSMVKTTTTPFIYERNKISELFRSGTYLKEAENFFMNSDNFSLVALAMAHKYTIVTHDEKNKYIRAIVNLPYICELLSINCITPFDMLKKENPKFVLKK